MSRAYQVLEGTDRVDRALFKIQRQQAALLLRLADGEPRQREDAPSAQALADRGLVEPFTRGHVGAYTLRSLGLAAAVRMRERIAAGAGLGKMRPQTKIERDISAALGVTA